MIVLPTLQSNEETQLIQKHLSLLYRIDAGEGEKTDNLGCFLQILNFPATHYS